MSKSKFDWIVLNQSQSPAFQEMLGSLAQIFGQCLIYTGAPYPTDGNHITIRKGPSYARYSMIRRLLSWLVFGFGALFCGLKYRKTRLLFVTTNPPFLLHIAWILHKLFKNSYAVLVWDIYPEHLLTTGFVREGNFLVRVWKALNIRAFKSASIVITIGDQMALTLRRHCTAEAVAVTVIPNWVDTNFIHPITKDVNPFALAHNQVGKLSVLYSGNIGKSHGVDIIVDVANELKDLRDVEFLIIGDGLGLPEIEKKIQDFKITNIKLIPYQPWHLLPQSLSCGDIAIVFQTQETAHLSVPSKIYSSMAAGSAIIACTAYGSDLATLVEHHGIGIVCSEGSMSEISSAIRMLFHKKNLLDEMRDRSREAALKSYDSKVILSHYVDALAPVLVNSQKP